MKTMKVAMYYNNNDIRIKKIQIPKIKRNEILVKVKASGICGSDVMEWYRIKKAPIVLGHEITGDIVKVGKNVENFNVGDRVFISHHVPCNICSLCKNDKHTLCDTLHSTNFFPGGFSEYIRIPEINVDRGTFILPKEITYNQGVFIEPLACVVRGMRMAEVKPKKTVLVIGSGIAGLLHIKLARVFKSNKIISTDINSYKLNMAKKVGADFVINAKENVIEKLKKYNDGMLADYVFLCAGAISAVKQAIESVECGGTIMLFAPIEPGINVPIPLFDLWNKEIKMISTYAGAPKDIVEAIELIKTKKILVDDMITHKLPLSEAEKGFKLVSDGTSSIKVILEP